MHNLVCIDVLPSSFSTGYLLFLTLFWFFSPFFRTTENSNYTMRILVNILWMTLFFHLLTLLSKFMTSRPFSVFINKHFVVLVCIVWVTAIDHCVKTSFSICSIIATRSIFLLIVWFPSIESNILCVKHVEFEWKRMPMTNWTNNLRILHKWNAIS